MPAETNIKRFIAILANPLSGKGKAIRIAGQLSEILDGEKIGYHLFTDHWPSQLQRYSEAWVVGGDGTINYFVNQYSPVTIPIALFSGGTGNDFAWKLYGDISVEKQASLVLAASPRPVDAASCNGRFYLNSLGIGFDGEVLRSIKTIRWMGGHLGYWLLALLKVFSFREGRFALTKETETLEDRFLLLIINNSSRTGGGFMVSPKASVSDGLLDLVLCKPLSVLKRLRYMPVIEKGKHLDLDFIQYSHAKKITVTCEKETPAAMDGELLVAQRFEICVHPACLLFTY